MKRICLTIILPLFGAIALNAQSNPAIVRESKFRNALWYGSDNASGQAFRPVPSYRDLHLSYEMKAGGFRPAEQAEGSDAVNVSTKGQAKIGKTLMWGSFAFRNIFDKNLLYNNILYEVEQDVPYYTMDTNKSRWNRQEYDMSAAMASPVFWERFSIGIDLRYLNRVGAKQKDPRVETNSMTLEIRPSATIRISDNHILGLNGEFAMGKELANPGNAAPVNHNIYILRGLGEGVGAVVGGNLGIQEFTYDYIQYGVGAQYNFSTQGFDALLDVYVKNRTLDVEQSMTMPKNMGKVKRSILGASFLALWGENFSDKITFSGSMRNSTGIELIQHRDDTPMNQRWVTDAENPMSQFGNNKLRLVYDHRFGARSAVDYRWDVGAQLDYETEKDTYEVAGALWNYSNIFAGVFGKRNIELKNSYLLLSLRAGSGINIGGTYDYVPETKKSVMQNAWQERLDYYKTSFVKAGGSIEYTIPSKKVNWHLALDADYSMPIVEGRSYRLVAGFRFGIIF